MKCFVYQPDQRAIEIALRPDAIGQECLNKVCDFLNIIETLFFGLQYLRNGQFHWLMLRKRIDQQINVRMKIVRLYLKVKFYVFPHHIQQNSTRHQFYLNILQNLEKENRLLIIDDEIKIKLIALIGQIEFGDFDQECFDLKVMYQKWIDLLFKISKTGQSLTRHSSNSLFNPIGWFKINRIYCDNFSHIDSTIVSRIQSNRFFNTINENADVLLEIIECHKKFAGFSVQGAKNMFLKECMEIENIGVDYFPMFAQKKTYRIGIGHRGLMIISNNENKLIAFRKLKEIHYRKTSRILNSSYKITISFVQQNNSVIERKFKIYCYKDVTAFYRLLTERRVFYSYSMVDHTVITTTPNYNLTFLNDFVNTFSSLNNSNAISKIDVSKNKSKNNKNSKDQSTGKLKTYVFDIDRTLKQFYDDVRRFIYHFNSQYNGMILALQQQQREEQPLIIEDDDDKIEKVSGDQDDHGVKEQLLPPPTPSSSSSSSVFCRICAEKPIQIILIPCGHTVCNACSGNVSMKTCPFCKNEIDKRQKIFI